MNQRSLSQEKERERVKSEQAETWWQEVIEMLYWSLRSSRELCSWKHDKVNNVQIASVLEKVRCVSVWVGEKEREWWWLSRGDTSCDKVVTHLLSNLLPISVLPPLMNQLGVINIHLFNVLYSFHRYAHVPPPHLARSDTHCVWWLSDMDVVQSIPHDSEVLCEEGASLNISAPQ